MKIWVIEIGEPLPLEKNVRLHRYGQFTRYLAKQGHSVTWWTSTFTHAKKMHVVPEDKEVVCEGVVLKLIKGFGYKRNVSFSRIYHIKEFAKKFYKQASKQSMPDLIICPIPAADIVYQAIKISRENGNIPVLTDIRDHWPDELAQLAPKELRPIAKLLLFNSYKKMRYVCKNVQGIMGVSQLQIDYGLQFAERVQNENDFLFPHGYTLQEFDSDTMKTSFEWLKNNGVSLDHPLTICFFGTIGKYFNIETVIEAIKKVKNEFPVQLIVGGDGSHLNTLKKLADGMENVHFVGWIDSPKIKAVMEISKIGIAPYKSGTVMSLPNKPFEYMAGKLAIVSSIQTELKGYLAQYNAGFTYDSDNADELCQIFRKLSNNKNLLAEMSKNAHELYLQKFSTEVIFSKASQHLSQVLGRSKHPSSSKFEQVVKEL